MAQNVDFGVETCEGARLEEDLDAGVDFRVAAVPGPRGSVGPQGHRRCRRVLRAPRDAHRGQNGARGAIGFGRRSHRPRFVPTSVGRRQEKRRRQNRHVVMAVKTRTD